MRAPETHTTGGNLAFAKTKATNTAIIGDDLSADKDFKTLQAKFAMRGHQLVRSNPADGPVSLYAERSGMVRYLPTLDDARRFLAQIGGAA